jgi:hypothetical protein
MAQPLHAANLGGLVTSETDKGPVLEDSEFSFMGDDFMWVSARLLPSNYVCMCVCVCARACVCVCVCVCV